MRQQLKDMFEKLVIPPFPPGRRDPKYAEKFVELFMERWDDAELMRRVIPV